MPGLPWRVSSFLTLLAIFALCVSIQYAPSVSAKDKGRATAAHDGAGAEADDADGKESKPARKTTTARKKARPDKSKKKRKGAGDDGDFGAGIGTSGGGTGSGSFAGGFGGPSTGASGNSGQGQATTAGSSGKPASSGSRGPIVGRPGGGSAANRAAKQAAAQQAQGPNPDLVQKIMDVQNRNTAALMGQKGIVGTATGLDDDENVVIRVYTTGADNPQIPKTIEGILVLEVLTGPVFASQSVGLPLYQQRIPRPVPIGVTAISDPGAGSSVCAAATLGCRLVDSVGNVYGLSNNHVWADENKLPIGNPAVQPSPLDDDCLTGISTDRIGTLFAFVPLIFDGTTPNPCDAAIIKTTRALINTSTLGPGYGVPTSTTRAAFLGQKLQKFGRTSGYTHGIVVGINVTITITYASGGALFKDFIDTNAVDGFPVFATSGDSGALVVDMNRNPVGIHVGHGGSDSFENPIDIVLSSLNNELVKQPGIPPGTTLQVDSSPPTPIDKEARANPNSP